MLLCAGAIACARAKAVIDGAVRWACSVYAAVEAGGEKWLVKSGEMRMMR